MAKLDFSDLVINGNQYNGYMQTNDTNDPPKVFFVFIDNYIVGNLIYGTDWTFQQVGQSLKKINSEELKKIADYLGNIVVLWYE